MITIKLTKNEYKVLEEALVTATYIEQESLDADEGNDERKGLKRHYAWKKKYVSQLNHLQLKIAKAGNVFQEMNQCSIAGY